MPQPRLSGNRGQATNKRLVVRVDLLGARPPIWRRLELEPGLRLDQIHAILHAAFSWDDSHLHEFAKLAGGGR